MALQIKRVKLPVKKVGQPFTLMLPAHARLERVGISPADGEPSLWYTTYADTDGNDVDPHCFVVVRDDGIVEDDGVAQHRGIWWEGDHTFHLYEVAVD